MSSQNAQIFCYAAVLLGLMKTQYNMAGSLKTGNMPMLAKKP